MAKHIISVNLIESKVHMLFIPDYLNIIADFIELIDFKSLEEVYEGVSSNDYEYCFQLDYVRFQKTGEYCEITITLPNDPRNETFETKYFLSSVGDYIRKYKELQAFWAPADESDPSAED